ncbi:MAG: hypothetical protein JHC93_07555, partial [Parachlamydiales bacterium]|nr:hypothetical protein [Parachlamydiales bacterium]
GATGPAGANGSNATATIDHYYNYNDAGALNLAIGANSAIPFAGNAISSGTSITQTNNTTFSINEVGNYQIQFVGNTTALSLLGSIQLKVGGVNNPFKFALLSGGSPVVLTQVIRVTTLPTTIQVIVTGLTVSFASGTSTNITITRLTRS